MNLKHLLGSALVAATVTFGAIQPAAALPGYIAGQEYGSRVTLRSGPSTGNSSLGYGLVGQDVELLDRVFNDYDGSWWVQVQFYESGAVGWIHGSYIGTY